MDQIDISIFEQRADEREIAHSITVPTYLIPNIGEEIYVANEAPLRAFLITGKRIVVMEDGKHHIALKAVRLNES